VAFKEKGDAPIVEAGQVVGIAQEVDDVT